MIVPHKSTRADAPRAEDPTPAVAARPVADKQRWVRRHRLAVALGSAVLAVALFLVIRYARPSSATAKGSGSAQGMNDMAGMAGMSTDGAVHLTPSQLTTFGVTFGTVERRVLTTDVRTAGTVVMDESRMAMVTPKISGFVERLYVNTTGQPVRRGAALAEIYSPDLIAAQEELLLARRLDRTIGRNSVPGVPSSAGGLLAAARRRLRLWDVSDAQIDDVLRTGRSRRTVTLYSPATGVVIEKKVTVGQAVQAGTEIYSIADLSEVWVDAQVRESDAADLRTGSGADLEFATYPGLIYKGRVTFLYPTVAEETRSLRARVAVANGDGRLKPGMYATVRILSPTRSALTAPRTAVLQTGDRAVVFVDRGNGALRPVDVKTGRSAGEYVEVLSGLEPGQRVVTSAQFLLDSESNLAEVMRSMIGMGGGASADGTGMKGMKGMDGGAPGGGADVKGMVGGAPAGGADMKGMDMSGGDSMGMEMKGADTRGMAGAARPATPPRAPR